MRKSDCASGSVTLIASLSMMLIAGLLFTMLEAGRFREMEKVGKMEADAAIESLFANYEPTLWEEYHFLALEAGASQTDSFQQRETYLKDLMEQSLGGFFTASVQNISLDKYLFVTDQEGAVFHAAATAYMENNFAYEFYRQISELSGGIVDLKNEDLDAYVGDAQELIEAAEAENTDTEHAIADLPQKPRILQNPLVVRKNREDETPLDVADEINATGFMCIALPKGTKVSGKTLDKRDVVSEREIDAGTGDSLETNFMQVMATEAYLSKYFSSYTNPIKSHGLTYELEYILYGFERDQSNLNASIAALIGIRELANFGYLLTDPKRCAKAESIATGIACVILQPELIEGIKYGILAAWAMAESVMDVRALLQGKKIALIKNSAQWSSDLSNLGSIFDAETMSEDCENGFDYNMYLMALLLLKKTSVKSLRAMDLMEATVRMQENRPDFCINDCIVETGLEVSYRYHSVFWGMDLLTKDFEGDSYVGATSKYSYRKAGA